MSLTSYRAAPPRVNRCENGKYGRCPQAAYVAIVTGLEKPKWGLAVRFRSSSAHWPHDVRELRVRGTRSPCHARMFYIFQMSERPALRPSVAVGEALRGVAHDILAEARAAIEDPARSEA